MPLGQTRKELLLGCIRLEVRGDERIRGGETFSGGVKLLV